MNLYHRYILVRAAKAAVVQGDHKRRIIDFYSILVDAARREFTEDNKVTLDSFLRECHQEALNENNHSR